MSFKPTKSPPPKRSEDFNRKKYLTETELVTLFTWMWWNKDNPEWQERIHLVRLVLGTGMRVSEMRMIRFPEDTFTDCVIYVRDDAEVRTKGRKDRYIRVSPEYEPWYLKRLEQLEKEDSKWFFPPRIYDTGVGGRRVQTDPPSSRTLEYWWEQVLEAAGVGLRDSKVRPEGKVMSIHKGRHTYATWEAHMDRLRPIEVKSQLGHISYATTDEYYNHPMVERLYQRDEPRWLEIAKKGLPDKRLRLVDRA